MTSGKAIWPTRCAMLSIAGPLVPLFLEDGRVAIDNNAAERAIRPIVIGRKNYLFAGSNAGGETIADAAIPSSETAKFAGLNPEAYLADVLGADQRPHRHTAPRTPALALAATVPAPLSGLTMAAISHVFTLAGSPRCSARTRDWLQRHQHRDGAGRRRHLGLRPRRGLHACVLPTSASKTSGRLSTHIEENPEPSAKT